MSVIIAISVVFLAVASLSGIPKKVPLEKNIYSFLYRADACPAGQFDCTGTGIGNGTSCINIARVCDNNVDCPSGGLDENAAMTCSKMSLLYCYASETH